jgi:hypothetical protein
VACDALMYSGVDASKWACAKDAVRTQQGISIDADSGEMSKMGFTLKWTYDAAAQTLSIQCTSKPFFITCGTVNGRIEGVAEQCNIAAA